MNLKDVDKQHNIYIIRSYYSTGESIIKVGYSAHIRQRLRSYPPTTEIVKTFYREDAKNFEKTLHRTVISKARNEWYDNSQLAVILKHIKNGFVEHVTEGKFAKIHNKQYVDYVKEIKECDTIGQKMTMLESVPNEKWKSYITYGLEKDNLLMNVKEARLFYESRNDYKGIIIAIYKKFKLGEFYSLVDIKSELNEIYKSKKFNRTAKATDLYEFFEIKSCNKRINGKLTSGVMLNSKK
jgi:hypothetical protein